MKKFRWAKIDLDMPDHPKIIGLSDAAFRVFIEMILWSARNQTDGFIPTAVAARKWGYDPGAAKQKSTEANTKQNASTLFHFASPLLQESRSKSSFCFAELSTNGDSPSIELTESGIKIYHFDEYQATTEKRNIVSKRRSEAGRLGGIASGKSRRKKAEANTKQNASVLLRKNEPELEIELIKEKSPKGDKKKVAAKRDGTRLSEDWQPGPETVQWTREQLAGLGIDPNRVFQVFQNYWISKAGANARKCDWDRTWRNWVLKEIENHQSRTSRRPLTQSEIMQANMQAAIAADYGITPPLQVIEGAGA